MVIMPILRCFGFSLICSANATYNFQQEIKATAITHQLSHAMKIMCFDLQLQFLVTWLLLFVVDHSARALLSDSSVIEDLPGFPGKLPFKLRTGYIGVGKSEEVQLFYYFVESERNPEKDPLMLWLTGGPGCSGFSGLVYEIGPLIFNYSSSNGTIPTLTLNPYSWTKVANIIFLDQPVGTGFSYATTSLAYNSSDTLAAQHTYEFLTKWLVNHPKYLQNELYIGGDSYAGIYVPQVVNHIYNGIDLGTRPLMNIKGYLLGNPGTVLFDDLNAEYPYANRMGLLSDDLYKAAEKNCNGNFVNPDPENVLCQNNLQKIDQCLNKIYITQILEPWCPTIFNGERRHLLSSYNILANSEGSWCREYNYVYSEVWANHKSVQQALHIRQETVSEWVRCNTSFRDELSYTFNVDSVFDYHKKFIHKDCRVLIYSGDHDMFISHLGTEKWISALNLPVQSDWRPWFVQGQVGGYTMAYVHDNYGLTYATVKGGGHTAPEYKPSQCFAMVERWFSGRSL